MKDLEELHWCCMCPKKAGFRTDIGYQCSACFYASQRVMIYLLETLGWRPMTKQEALAHEHHINS